MDFIVMWHQKFLNDFPSINNCALFDRTLQAMGGNIRFRTALETRLNMCNPTLEQVTMLHFFHKYHQ